jgi:predicted nuclease of predicted toxin-antitoxin system
MGRFKKAINEDRVVITFDLDFAEIAALTEGKKASVILFRLRNTRAPHVIERLSTVLENSSEALEKGAVVVVEESRHRVRFLPIGETGGKP